MKFSQPATASLALLLQTAHLAVTVNAQTPPTSQPSTETNLIVTYNGTSVVETDMLLFPDQVSTRPSISLSSRVSGTHMIALLDLSISGGRFNGTTLPLVQGLQTCRTTRLHWLQTGLVQAENGTFVVEGDTPALAPYGGSNPTLNDIPHTFTFYLFAQPDDFVLPAWDAGRNYTALGAPDRLNVSVSAIAELAGQPVAAEYYRTYNRSNTATGTFGNGTCPVSLSGGDGNGTTGGSGGNGSVGPVVEFTGLAGRVRGVGGLGLVVVGGVVFGMI